jgi:hypothetical protein
VGGLLLVVVIGFTFLMQRSKAFVLQQLEAVINDHASQGVIITYHTKELAGWPWDLRLTLRDVSVYKQSVAGWKALNKGEVIIKTNPLQGTALTFHSPTPFRIMFDLPQLPEIHIAQMHGQMSYLNPLKTAAIELRTVTVLKKNQALLGLERVFLESAAVTAEPGSDQYLEGWHVEINHLHSTALPFSQIQRLTARLAVTGDIEAAPLPQMMQKWMQSGGTIELSELAIEADKLNIIGQGTLSLDENLQPLATFTAHVHGIEETIDDLTMRQVITPSTAKIYKMALALALMTSQSQQFTFSFQEKKPQEKQPLEDKSLTLSFTIQGNALHIGATEILKLPQLDWEKLTFHP